MSSVDSKLHRLFIGFPIELTSSLSSALKKLRITAQKKEMAFNWSPTANLHVTLNFLGETEESRISELGDLISRVSEENPPFSTSLKGLGAFPDERHMRVLWAGVLKSRDLSRLQENMRSTLVSGGFPLEDRAYIPHLTLGRLRKSRSSVDLISPFVRASFGDLNITQIALFESLNQGSHPVYKILRTFNLSGSADQASDEEFMIK